MQRAPDVPKSKPRYRGACCSRRPACASVREPRDGVKARLCRTTPQCQLLDVIQRTSGVSRGSKDLSGMRICEEHTMSDLHYNTTTNWRFDRSEPQMQDVVAD
jgi:hypothetical protein